MRRYVTFRQAIATLGLSLMVSASLFADAPVPVPAPAKSPAAAPIPTPPPAANPIPVPAPPVALPAPAQVPAKVEVFPPDVALATSRGRQVFVVQATFADGITRDVTAEAKTALANPGLAKLDKNLLTPLADGATVMNVEFGGKTVAVPLTVKDAAKDRPISFKLDVMPIFMRNGCNQGSCHGAARGKDGFRLSLFGFDPDGDHFRLTREMNGRRVNLALPKERVLI